MLVEFTSTVFFFNVGLNLHFLSVLSLDMARLCPTWKCCTNRILSTYDVSVCCLSREWHLQVMQVAGLVSSTRWPLDNYSPAQLKLCSTIASNFLSCECLILTSFAVGRNIVMYIFLRVVFSRCLGELSCCVVAVDDNPKCLVCVGREKPSVAGIINPSTEGFQKLFFGQ